MKMAWGRAFAACTLVAALAGACAPATTKPRQVHDRLVMVGDSMFAANAVDEFNEWFQSGRFSAVWARPYNGAGFLKEPSVGVRLLEQLPPSGTWYESLVVSCCWNDAVVGGYPADQVIPLVDQLIDMAVAEGVACMRWVLNRDDHLFNHLQAGNWGVSSLAEMEHRLDELAVINQHIRDRAAESPIAGTLDLAAVEWGVVVGSELVQVTLPAYMNRPAITGVWWSGTFDKGVAGVADQQDGWPKNDLDTVHPGDHGNPSGSDRMVSMVDAGLSSCPA